MGRIGQWLLFPGILALLLISGGSGSARAANCDQAAELAREAAKLASGSPSAAQSRLEKAVDLCLESTALSF